VRGWAARTIFLSRGPRGPFLGRGLGDPILVPETVSDYEDISEVISQIKPLENALPLSRKFGFTTQTDLESRMVALAYFLGVMAGDMSKYPFRRKTYNTMKVRLQLSKRHRSNLRFGGFVAYCATLLGIRMKRIGDYIRPKEWPYDAYRWDSQHSELLMWIFEACLGLGFDERTTDDCLRANWLKEAPFSFQRSFVQGLADSDGYVDLNKHEVGIIVDPNEFLIADILYRLKVRFRSAIVKTQATVMLGVKEAYALPIFNPRVRTHKFELTKKLSEAKRFQGPWPKWLRHEVDQLVSLGRPPSEITLTILDNRGVAIRSQHLRKLNGTKILGSRIGAEGGI